jgi:hypothetical protein
MALSAYGRRNGAVKAADRGARKTAGTFGKPAHFTLPSKNDAYVVESPAERLSTDAFALDPGVRRYRAQPYTVDLIDRVLLATAEAVKAAYAKHAAGGVAPAFYTPDFDLEWTLGTHSAVEVKLEGYTGDPLYEEKLRDVSEVLWLHAIELIEVVIPSYWRHPLWFNLPLLHQATLRRDLAPTQDVLARVEILAAAGANTLQEYCSGLGFDNRMAPVLIAHGALDVDVLQHALLNTTPAKPAMGSLEHLGFVRRLAR